MAGESCEGFDGLHLCGLFSKIEFLITTEKYSAIQKSEV